MNNIDISRRLKIMRGVSAASLGRVASLSTAGAMEGAALAGRIVRDPRGRVLVGAAALGLALALNLELAGNIAQFFQGADLSGLPQIDLNGIQLPQVELPRVELPFVSIPGAEGSTGAPQAPPTVSFPEAGVTQPVVAPLTQAPAPEVVTSGSYVGPGMETAAPVVTTAPEVQAAPTAVAPSPEVQTAPPVVEAVASPIATPAIPETVWSQIRIGEPIERQILDLAQNGQLGNPTEAFNNLYKETFLRFGDNFLTTAQAMLRGEGGPYTPQQLVEAQAQVDSINQLRANPSIDSSTPNGISLFRQAMHYWRPL